jgi:hypothetical protein
MGAAWVLGADDGCCTTTLFSCGFLFGPEAAITIAKVRTAIAATMMAQNHGWRQ